ncbi:DUF1552 domain-containing protein [Lignipirellula cremea]|uniref:DUF1552 domain-containing protein n=1 Tax=Lignipirellula cremea TaxID=2528010 RepID=A0A518DKG0_9BACT|nr:DUF1552 domain-containing protein [Lignipirellula cremea]QDU92321.1 hypothetical protein Pla8534_00660 [Lignipirellula cremea]
MKKANHRSEPAQTGISRRDMLRGVGAAVALPWLESLAAAEQADKQAGPPQRFACFYIANGVQGWDETTQQADGAIRFGDGLSPLADLAAEINIIKGLRHENSIGGTHGHKGPVVLSGAKVKTSTTDVRAGATLDQVLAGKIGNHTLQPSLVLGVEPPCPGVDSNLSSVYLNNISWSSPTRPAPREIHPALAFDSMFGAGPNRLRTKSILDAVLEDAKDLGREISTSDNRRLDEYLSSVRDVERRVERLGQSREYLTWQPALDKPDRERPADHIPEKLADHMRLMLEIIVLSFRMDRTRIATLMFNNERSQQNFGFLDGVNSSAYHALSHGSKEVHARVTNFHSQMVAEFLRKLKSADEGGESILHNSQVLFLSGMHDGSHYAGRLPVLLAGRAGGKLKTGRVLSFDDKSDKRLCRLLLSVADNMGAPLPQFGDADERFDEFC